MRRVSLLALIAMAGCTHVQLQASTVKTAGTVMEIQYQMVMDNLARMVRNPSALPSLIRIKQGTVQVSDEWGLYRLTVSGDVSGSFGGPRAERTVSEQWGADAISDPRAIKKLQDLYRTAMQLRPLDDPGFLRQQQRQQGKAKQSSSGSDDSGESSQNAIDLTRDVPHGWFHAGVEGQVPDSARYVGHSGKVRVWVMPDDIGDLSRFTLAMLFVTKLGPGEDTNSGPGLMYTGGGR